MKQLQTPINPSSLTSDLMKNIRKKILSLLYTIIVFPDNLSALLPFCEVFNIWKLYIGQNDLFVASNCSYFYIAKSVIAS